MSLAEWSGEHVEYAIRYDAPEDYAGVTCTVVPENELWRVARIVADENACPNEIRCHVVKRTVTYSDWTDA